MGASRIRAGLVIASAAAIALGGIVAPSVANAVVVAPANLSPNDPTSAPTSSVPGTPRKNVVLSWSPVANTTSYQVQVSDFDGSFLRAAIDTTTTTTTFAPSASLPRGDYSWRVRATGGTWSDPAYFTRGWTAAPGNPRPVGDHITTGVTLAWNGLADASYYEVQISPSPFRPGQVEDAGNGTTETGALKTCITSNTVFTPYVSKVGNDGGIRDDSATTACTEWGGGPWFWRVRGRDGVYDPTTTKVTKPAAACTGVWYDATAPTPDGSKDDCSAWAYPAQAWFGVIDDRGGPELPDAPTGTAIAPHTGSSTNPVVTANPAFSWDPVAEADFYRVYVSRYSNLGDLDHMWETQSTNLAPILQEKDRDHRYYWGVEACVDNSPPPEVPEPVEGEEPPEPEPDFVLDYDDKADIDCSDMSEVRTYRKATPNNVQNVSTTAVTGGRTFRWTTAHDASTPSTLPAVAVQDVKGYELQFSDNYGLFEEGERIVKVDRQGNVTGQASATIPSAKLPSGFKWQVRGIDSSNNEYPWSTPTTVGTLASATGKLTTASGFALTAPLNVSFNSEVSGVTSSSLKIVAASNNVAVPGVVSVTGATGYRFTPTAKWVAGESYRLSLTPAVTTDATSVPAVASTATIRAFTTVDSASSSLTKVTGDYSWVTASATDAQGKSYVRSNDKASTAKRSYVETKVRGTKVTVYGCFGKSSGNARITVDGVTRATVNLYRKSSSCGTVATISLASGSQHTVRFFPIGTKAKQATSTQVRFDGFKVT